MVPINRGSPSVVHAVWDKKESWEGDQAIAACNTQSMVLKNDDTVCATGGSRSVRRPRGRTHPTYPLPCPPPTKLEMAFMYSYFRFTCGGDFSLHTYMCQSITAMTVIIDEMGSYEYQFHFEVETYSSPDEGIFIRTVANLILFLAR